MPDALTASRPSDATPATTGPAGWRAWRTPALVVVLLGSVIAALTLGAYRLDPSLVWWAFSHADVVADPASAADPARAQAGAQALAVLWQIRLPRVVIALAVGMGLGLAGSALQALFRNPLADPGLLGISSGAALGASLMLVCGAAVGLAAGGVSVAIAAFVGALVTASIVYRLASSGGRLVVAMLLLAGIAINALTGAAIGILTYLADDAQLRSLTFWSLGSLGGVQWPTLAAVLPCVAIGGGLLLRQRRALNVMQLGEVEAAHLGVSTQRVKREVMLGASLCVGALVSCTGLIGFVGLVTPHAARLVCGPDLRRAMPVSMLIGAVLTVLADLVARTIAAPADVPIGILTALIGAPCFLSLLWRNRHRFGA